MHPGLIHIYTGDGKGKTTAALGLTLRVLGWGKKIAFVQFIKGNKDTGEFKFFASRTDVILKQFGFEKMVNLDSLSDKQEQIIKQGWDFSQKIIKEGQHDILIMDEFNLVLHHGIIPSKEVVDFFSGIELGCEVIFTGRNAPEKILSIADYVTEMKQVKHPFEKKINARKSIEY